MQEMQKDENDDRIQEIFHELSECREDERSSQAQIVQVLSTSAAILGVVYALGDASLAMLVLIDTVFSTAFAFIITLGIGNVLRYHYIQDLEDRLDILIDQGADPNKLVHWMSFSSPVTTRNPKHLNSKYSRIHFACYTLATVSAVVFSGFITYYQYKRLDSFFPFNELALAFPAVFMAMTVFVFFYVCVKSKDMYDYAMKNSILKQRKRMKEKRYSKKNGILLYGGKMETEENSFKHRKFYLRDWIKVAIYFLYPKLKDLQKSSLILFGFLVGMFLVHIETEMVSNRQFIYRLFLALFVVDGLVYQARYQWNDIRGLREDMEMKKTDRLPANILGKWPAVVISLVILFLKLGLALFIAVKFGGDIKIPLFISILSILILSIFYEAVRTMKWNKGIFIFVGLGYPLRVFTGIWAARPELCKLEWEKLFDKCLYLWNYFTNEWVNGIVASDIGSTWLLIIFLLVSFFFYGEFCVMIPWTCEALKQKSEKRTLKSHYQYLFKKLQKRGSQTQTGGEDLFGPLRVRGEIRDPWNMCYLLAMAALPFGFLLEGSGSFWYFLLEILTLIFSILMCWLPKKISLYIVVMSAVLIIAKMFLYLWMVGGNIWINCILIIQILFLLSYFVLRYSFDPDFHMLKFVLEIIIGKDTLDYIKS